MTVSRDYMLKKPDGPSAAKHFLHTQLVPRAVNIAGEAEVALSRASARTGIRPALILAGVAAAAVMTVFQLRQSRASTGNRRI
ncbi:hypothetical protein [Methylobacterium pseudosasicola]|uniref:Uncharacterized protein n=1 Tax=Methylobacterium pseudosasicola TaxID=582667 RepID=A0A1I4IFQ6_9HYPH|nr:hypothetical protein [Methylobacterium pseudosasicola]SFL52853.1 hypothetical protein SAMN05192568_1006105 [Methylobacterium pseudosasicola]